MALFEACVERASALAATCGWLALGGGTEAAVGLVIGGGSLVAAVSASVRKHGPESESALRVIRKRIALDLASYAQAENWETRSEIAAADAAMDRALSGCFLDRQALAGSTRSSDGFPVAAGKIILGKLGEREPEIFGPDGPKVARDYAEVVIQTALKAAIDNEDYFKGLHPHLLMETLRGLGSIEEKVDAMHVDIRKILDLVKEDHSPSALATKLDEGRFEITANEAGAVLLFHDRPLPYPIEALEFDYHRRELFFVFPGEFKRSWGIPVSPNIAENMSRNGGRCLLVLVDARTLEPIGGRYVDFRKF